MEMTLDLSYCKFAKPGERAILCENPEVEVNKVTSAFCGNCVFNTHKKSLLKQKDMLGMEKVDTHTVRKAPCYSCRKAAEIRKNKRKANKRMNDA
jgi:hypothetical protein